MTSIAKIISYLFHPLLMLTYGISFILFGDFIFFFASLTESTKWVLMAIVFSFTFLFPFFNSLIFLRLGKIKSLEMETSNERNLPYITTTIYYFALFYLCVNADFPSNFSALILGASLNILATYIINFRWKISAHAIGIGGISGAILALSNIYVANFLPYFLISIFIAGSILSARLLLNSHNPSQVYTGYALGFIIQFIVLVIT